MSVTAQSIYDSICYDLLEDAGLVLGLLTVEQFFDLLNLTILDFNTQTAMVKGAFTQQILSNVGRYTIPDELTRVDQVYVAGRLVSPAQVADLNTLIRNWRRAAPGIPTLYHEDELPIRTLELVVAPNYSGVAITGGSAPGFYVAGQSPAVHRNLTLVGPLKPAIVGGPEEDIPIPADDAITGYLGFGVLERVFSSDSELQDQQRALYCGAQYREGVLALQAMMGEVEVDS